MRRTPTSASASAIRTLSSTVKATSAHSSPSRTVMSCRATGCGGTWRLGSKLCGLQCQWALRQGS